MIAGRATPLIDGIEKVTGRARYTADLGANSLVGDILRSPHAHAEIVRIDTSRARALPGVHAVLTGADCSVPYGILPIAHNEYPLARERVRYWGEPVAAVAAEDERIARAALELIEVEYRPLPAVFEPAGGARRRGAAPRRQAAQHRARGRAVVRRCGRRFRRRRSGARGKLPLRRSHARPDGARRRARRVRRRARAAHAAIGHAGALLRAPDARPVPRDEPFGDPRGQALRRRRLRPPHRVPQLRDHRGASRARRARHGPHRAVARADLRHAPRPAADRHPPQDRPEEDGRDHRGRRRMRAARRRLCRLRHRHHPLRRRAAARAVPAAGGEVSRPARVHQHAALRPDARPRLGRHAPRLRIAARCHGL